jgi:cytochrome oxidase Cu insertion factor (SCO1/SenC/PrrC family)
LSPTTTIHHALNRSAVAGFLDAFDVPVNYVANSVNIHGVALYLLDANGRLARTYHTTVWDNSHVIKDLNELAVE